MSLRELCRSSLRDFISPPLLCSCALLQKKKNEGKDVDLKPNRRKERERLMRQESDDVKPNPTLCQEYVSMPSARLLLVRTLLGSEVLRCN